MKLFYFSHSMYTDINVNVYENNNVVDYYPPCGPPEQYIMKKMKVQKAFLLHQHQTILK